MSGELHADEEYDALVDNVIVGGLALLAVVGVIAIVKWVLS